MTPGKRLFFAIMTTVSSYLFFWIIIEILFHTLLSTDDLDKLRWLLLWCTLVALAGSFIGTFAPMNTKIMLVWSFGLAMIAGMGSYRGLGMVACIIFAISAGTNLAKCSAGIKDSEFAGNLTARRKCELEYALYLVIEIVFVIGGLVYYSSL